MTGWIIFAVVAVCVLLYCKFGKSIGHVPDFRKLFSAFALIVYLIIMIVMSLAGCASSKNVDRNTQVDYSGALTQMQSRMDSLLVNMQLQRKEVSEKLSNLKIENKTVYYSRPDSTGKQYPTIVSETNVNKEDKETNTTDTELDITILNLIKEVTELRQKLDTVISDKEKVVEVSWWDLHKLDVYAGVFGLIIVGWVLYRWKKK